MASGSSSGLKKGGGGGKFTFGRPEDQDGPAALDEGDLNYDRPAGKPDEDEHPAAKSDKPASSKSKRPLACTPVRSAASLMQTFAARGHHVCAVTSRSGESPAACVACGKGVPRMFAQCTTCGLCSGCCMQGVVRRCPCLANGCHLHHCPMQWRPIRNDYCAVGGERCGSAGGCWRCDECELEICPSCMAKPPPEGFERSNPQPPGSLSGWVPVCNNGHLMRQETRPSNTCDRCNRRGTQWRCSQGCDWDYCQDCHRLLSEGGGQEYDAAAAEQLAARRWELQGDQDPAQVGAVVGTGVIEEVGGGAAAHGQPAAAAGMVPGVRRAVGKGRGKGGSRRPVFPPGMPPPLNRHLSRQSQDTLNTFAMGADAAKFGVADVATAEELLARVKDVEAGPELREAVRGAVASGDLALAGQLLLAESFGGDGAEGESKQLCPVCYDVLDGTGGTVGCLGGHRLHAGCAADLALGGAPCPTCRAPLFYAAASVTTKDIATHKSRTAPPSVVYTVGDRVLITGDVDMAARRQNSHPLLGGWHEDMAPCCGREGEVTLVCDEVAAEDGAVRAVHVRCLPNDGAGRGDGEASGPVWRWHPSLVTLVQDSEDTARGASQADEAGRKQVARLRDELAVVQRDREGVREEMMAALGLSPSISAPSGAPTPPMLTLKRAESVSTATSVRQLRELGIALVDVQRAKRLIAIAKLWGDQKAAVVARNSVHDALREGKVELAARSVRHHNVSRRFEEALWAQAARPTSHYRVAPGVRAELLAAPRRGARRTGFVLAPGAEFASSRELLDEDGNLWLRVGEPTSATVACAGEAANLDKATSEGPTPVLVEDLPAAIGARVRRGANWDWGDQDGGPGNQGTLHGYDGNTEGWVTVEWDVGGRNNYRAGAEGRRDLEYVNTNWKKGQGAASGSRARLAQGWLLVRPGGPGSTSVAAAAGVALACFACGGDLEPPFSCSHASRLAPGTARVPFAPVKSGEATEGAVLLVAATLDEVVVERTEQLQEGGDAAVVCRFRDNASKSAGGGCDFEDDLFVYRLQDLVWPGSMAGGQASLSEKTSHEYQGLPLSRRELTLKLGSVDAAREEWGGCDVPEDRSVFASCVRGHYMHARCFQGCLVAGKGCPTCGEPLFAPTVTREIADDEACCGGERETAEEEALRLARAAGQAASSDAAAAGDPTQLTDRMREMDIKMCPVCFAGPLMNENCADMQAHHGECPRCRSRPFSAAQIAEAVAQRTPGSVGSRIPQCAQCRVPVMFNGCVACGHLFVGTRWGDLPKWDPKAKLDLDTNERYLRSVRLLAGQVREQASLLAHERAALAEALGPQGPAAGQATPLSLDFGERAPEPRLNRAGS